MQRQNSSYFIAHESLGYLWALQWLEGRLHKFLNWRVNQLIYLPNNFYSRHNADQRLRMCYWFVAKRTRKTMPKTLQSEYCLSNTFCHLATECLCCFLPHGWHHPRGYLLLCFNVSNYPCPSWFLLYSYVFWFSSYFLIFARAVIIVLFVASYTVSFNGFQFCFPFVCCSVCSVTVLT